METDMKKWLIPVSLQEEYPKMVINVLDSMSIDKL